MIYDKIVLLFADIFIYSCGSDIILFRRNGYCGIRVKMKKKLAIILAAVLCLSFTMTSCGDDKDKKAEEPAIYDYDLAEYVELGQYLGLEATNFTAEVTDDQVKEEIEKRVAAAVTYDYVKEGVVKDGDTVNIDYVGRIDGEEFEGGSSNPDDGGFDLTIGSGRFIEGFEEGLIGKSVGDENVLNLTFPEGYETNPALAGKAVEFTVKINSIRITNTPEYNLDFVKANSDCTSLEEYEKQVYDELYATAYETAESEWEGEIWNRIVEGCTFLKYPEKEVNKCTEDYRSYYEQYATYLGSDFESFLASMNVTQEQFDEDAKEYANGVVENEMVLFRIAQEEGLTVTDEEYKDGIVDLMKKSGFDDEESFKETYGTTYEEYVGKENILVTLTMDKVWKLIKDSLVING